MEELSRYHPFHNIGSREPMLVNPLMTRQRTMHPHPLSLQQPHILSYRNNFPDFVNVLEYQRSLVISSGHTAVKSGFELCNCFSEPSFELHTSQRHHHLTSNYAETPPPLYSDSLVSNGSLPLLFFPIMQKYQELHKKIVAIKQCGQKPK